MTVKPLMKWTGGKTDELPFILPRIPKFNRYVEPFAGGAAVLWNMPAGTTSLASDMSEDLINLYNLCKNSTPEFLSRLQILNDIWNSPQPESAVPLMNAYPFTQSSGDYENRLQKFYKKLGRSGNDTISVAQAEITSHKKAMYHLLRDEFNASLPNTADRAALFWVMRELAYNGMFRHNASGHFNIPYGGRTYDGRQLSTKFSKITTEPYREILDNTIFVQGDFSILMNSAENGDFIFLDPPYDSPFSTYDKNAFNRSDHIRLRNALLSLPEGVQWMMVIGHTPFTEETYAGLPNVNRVNFDKRYRTNIRNRFSGNAYHMCLKNFNS